jgi:predicted RNase H-like HicB family nuclease
MKTIMVEGYEVEITRADDKYFVSVPKLPGCSVQVDKEEDAPREIRKMIGTYMQGLASLRPKNNSNPGDAGKGRENPPAKIRR